MLYHFKYNLSASSGYFYLTMSSNIAYYPYETVKYETVKYETAKYETAKYETVNLDKPSTPFKKQPETSS